MFAKLLKYEWRSNAATCGVLSLCALGVSVLGGIGLRFLAKQDLTNLEGSAYFSLMMLLLVAVLSLAAYAIAVYVLQLVRFYKSRFTDEGYLTFTLPVSVHQIFLSAAVNMLLWALISALVLGICLTIMYLFATVGMDYPIDPELLLEVGLDSSGYGLLDGLAQIVSAVFGVILPMTCLTVGACIAKKHKILAAFGIYYAISAAMSFMQGVMTMATIFGTGVYDEVAYSQLQTEQTVITLVVELIVVVAGYFLSTSLLKKRLNLN